MLAVQRNYMKRKTWNTNFPVIMVKQTETKKHETKMKSTITIFI